MAERTPPVVEGLAAPFWRGGAEGQLLIQRCADCRRWFHPPVRVCSTCLGRALGPEAVSGRATVWSWTVNRYRWSPGIEPPYVLAEVELPEQEGLRLLTTIVDVALDEVAVGLPVRVRFEPAGDAWVPVFAP